MLRVIPRPAAAFSPFAISTSKLYFLYKRGKYCSTASRPIEPTISPINNTFILTTTLSHYKHLIILPLFLRCKQFLKGESLLEI